ncbi:hypothetical protein COCON_G00070170 [Conger conger]|uniref:E3 ubiquitin-protein ligase n=1 Tax=Conger conger TaxID=82655 RepID=A0A9Q1I4C0_CONCO|nr:hypothetical protein COCON_G00070170 [Conger conger]
MFTFHSFIKDSSINGEKFIMMLQLMGMQKQLGATQSKFQQRIQEREKELQDLRQAVQSLKRSAQAAVEDSERIFTEMIRSIERRCSEVKELIRDQEKAEEAHPNPGKPFTGLHTQSCLPDSPEGRRVLKLLQRAFEQKLIFTVAATHGAADRVIFTDIPHDASGPECKQPGFLQRLKAALRAKGIE